MADYDSDSSEQEFTETNVLLGYATKDADEDTISRLGGRPDWLNPDQPPSAALARCKICNDIMVQLLQLNGELPEKFPGHERRLYVFACRRPSCRRKQGSIRALRGVRISKDAPSVSSKKQPAQKTEVKKEEEPKKDDGPGLGSALFGGGSGAANPFASNTNPFSTGSSSSPFSTTAPSSNPFSKPSEPKPTEEAKPEPEVTAESLPKTFAETLSLNNPQTPSGPPPPSEPWPEVSAQPKPYPLSYLADAEFETLDPEPAAVPQNVRMEVDDGAGGAGGSTDTKDVFESSMDAIFQKFADRMAQNPEQAIRYEYGGVPLLYSKADAVGKALTASGGKLPRCGNCGAGRVFEVQMTPHAITELEAEELSLEGMDWGTIIVGVCEADCQQRGVEVGGDGYLEEWCGVQWEELAKR
ncbi:programmed cell death protein 2, C-terminal domain containing protein [Colletotrichum truncatum]|uniref:Programmed cell death protein 2, C-terminal domain containing protein n=1 Tax=Colletotrichum truncatum TaxID=5467 RepID=A0ACC3Z6L8_COLTU|nr:programmed cell death protein 2, C-terminal domain containing protein [Colletotrichum truncatum]KAF6788018.1 programmed cell death protein 2, C-terminal domain containing protein [Colletotrichum truncatum]